MVWGDGAGRSEASKRGGGHVGTDSAVDRADFSGDCRVCVCEKRGGPWSIRPGSGRHYRRDAGGAAAEESLLPT